MKQVFLPFLLLLLGMANVVAQDSLEVLSDTTLLPAAMEYDIPVVNILGARPRLLGETPGSAAYIDARRLRELRPITGNEALRTISGLVVVDEEGAGLRINVGIRGLNPDRSRNVLMLEDGVPVALNPYGEPEMYYAPPIDRMEAIEVLKGSGQVLFGPQTIGGVINFITAEPPENEEFQVKLRAGQGGYFSGLFGYGNTVGNSGFQINYLHKRAEQLGVAGFDIHDFNTKVRWQLNRRSRAVLKMGFYDEVSNATYVGLTQSMYDAGGQDFVLMAPDDRMKVQRISASLLHEYRFNYHVNLKTTVYGYTTTRNWQRQDFASSLPSNWTGVVWGDTTVAGGAVFMRDSNGHRNRRFIVAGAEPRLTVLYQVADQPGKLQAGLRLHREQAFEQRVNGTKPDARSGNLVNDEIRSGTALSAFVHDKQELGERFSITLGLRGEYYEFERNILRRSSIDTSIVALNSVAQLIPGLGFNLLLHDQLNVFGGIHRGFAPPRIVDAITAAGEVFELDPELSWNSELGLRSQLGKLLSAELTGFYMDFSNQIIPLSESSGGMGAGLVNAGRTLHYGAELGLLANFSTLLPSDYLLQVRADLTRVEAIFNSDRFVNAGGEAVNINGNRTPYAPAWTLSTGVDFEMPFGLGLQVQALYLGDQYTDQLNRVAPTPDGRNGLMESYFVLDAGIRYAVPSIGAHFHASVKNLLDERYIVTRRPQGIRVGLPRFVSFGIDFQF